MPAGAAGGNVASAQGVYVFGGLGPSFQLGIGGGGFSFFNWFKDFPYWVVGSPPQFITPDLPQIDRRDIETTYPEVPLGTENILSVSTEPGVELSDLVIAESSVDIHATTADTVTDPWFGAPPPPPVEVVNAPLSDAEWLAKMGLGPPVVQQPVVQPTNLVEEESVGVFDDLGDVFVDWVRAEVTPPQFQPTAAPVTGQPIATQAGVAPQQMGAVCAPEGPSPVWKKVCGVYKWVYPKRRRRRALLTEGDYNSLLRIEGLKVNKNMTAAIAKALTR